MKKDFWDEGGWLDMWSVVHLLSGVCAGIIFYQLGLSLAWSFTVTSVLFISWEALEYVWKWEKITNHLADVLINYLGYLIFYLFYYVFNWPFSTFWASMINGIFIVLNIWGFWAYKQRGRGLTL